MSHNYYEDYDLQYRDDIRNKNPPQLSEAVQHGIAYCSVVLFHSLASAYALSKEGEKRLLTGDYKQGKVTGYASNVYQGTMGAIVSARSKLMRHEFDKAVAALNPVTTADISFALDNLRTGTSFLDFDSSFTDEMYAVAAASDRGAVLPAVLTAFPVAAKSQHITAVIRQFLEQCNAAAFEVLDERTRSNLVSKVKEGTADRYTNSKYPNVLSGRNPFLVPVVAMYVADTIAVSGAATVGRVQPGTINKEQRFSHLSSFVLNFPRSDENRYRLLRRLRRAGTSYSANFPLYLTYLTDACRIIEHFLPISIREVIDSDVEEAVLRLSVSKQYFKQYN